LKKGFWGKQAGEAVIVSKIGRWGRENKEQGKKRKEGRSVKRKGLLKIGKGKGKDK